MSHCFITKFPLTAIATQSRKLYLRFHEHIFKDQRERDNVMQIDRQADRKVSQMHLWAFSTGQTAPHIAVKILLYQTQMLKMPLISFTPSGRSSSFRSAEVLQRAVSECQVKARWIRVIYSTWLLPNPTI